MQVILFIGIPASGKSTFYQCEFSDTHVRINRDMLKTKNRVARLYELCLEIEQPCVLDNTNVSRSERSLLIEMAQSKGAEVIGYYFGTNLKRSLAWNQTRAGKARLPDVAVLGHHGQLEIPDWDEGFTKLFYVGIENDEFLVSPMES